jgi:hypothetical protein
VAIIHTENAMIVEFPRSRMRRILSRRQRRSKNGTPEERAAKAAAVAPGFAEPRVIQRRRSKNGTFEERQAKTTVGTMTIVAFAPRAPERKAEPRILTREEFETVFNRLSPRQQAAVEAKIAAAGISSMQSDEPEPAA